MGITVEPAFDPAGKVWTLLMRLAQAHGALMFWQNSVMDDHGRYYLAPGGGFDADSQLPVFPSAAARKTRSEARLMAMGVPFLPSLPVVPADEEVLLRDPAEVARRAIGLVATAMRNEMGQENVLGVLSDHGFSDVITPNESDYVHDANPSQQDVVQFTWRYESLYLLLWALGHMPVLTEPDSICSVPEVTGLMKQLGLREMVANARLRSAAEILDELDFIYRCHWAATEARIKNQADPPGLDRSVVFERHYALNWLTCHEDEDWDDVTTDT